MNGHEKQREQSSQMIRNALFELLDEKEFSKITVSEIVKRADVARRTFYRMYDNKEDIIHDYFRRLCCEYQNTYQALNRYNLKQISTDYFSFWYKEKSELLKLYRAGLDTVVYYEINHASAAVIGKRIGNEKLRDSAEMEHFAVYSVGGFINLLFRWIESGMEESPDEYADKVCKSINKFLCQQIENTDWE